MLFAHLRPPAFFAEAVALVQKAVSHTANEAEASHLAGDLGEVLRASGNQKEAERVLREALGEHNVPIEVGMRGISCGGVLALMHASLPLGLGCGHGLGLLHRHHPYGVVHHRNWVRSRAHSTDPACDWIRRNAQLLKKGQSLHSPSLYWAVVMSFAWLKRKNMTDKTEKARERIGKWHNERRFVGRK